MPDAAPHELLQQRAAEGGLGGEAYVLDAVERNEAVDVFMFDSGAEPFDVETFAAQVALAVGEIDDDGVHGGDTVSYGGARCCRENNPELLMREK